MIKIKIKLKESNPLDFCKILNTFKSNFDIYSGRFIIDGKSLLGLFSLDLEKEMYLNVIEKNDEIESILQSIENYICE